MRFASVIGCVVLCLAMLPQRARAEIELSYYLGPQTTYPSTIRSPTLGDDRVTWRSEAFVIPPHYGVRAKWWSKGRLGFGLDFVHTKAFADDPAKYGYEELNISHGLNMLTADLWYRFDPVGRVTPYIGAGAGIVVPHVEVKRAGIVPTARYQVAGPAVTVVAGASLPLGKRWAVFSEYKASYSEVRATLDSGDKLNSNFVTDSLNFGLTLRF